MKICGPKLSLCGLLISIWGVIQLVLMGLFYYVKSVALIEDLGIEEKFENINDFYAEADKRYTQSAYNCWIAACLYIFTLLFSAHQFYLFTFLESFYRNNSNPGDPEIGEHPEWIYY